MKSRGKQRKQSREQGGEMFWVKRNLGLRRVMAMVAWIALAGGVKIVHAQNQVMGELEFEGKSKVEQDSGVWVDGNYVGYLKELKGNKKVMLLPGTHEVTVRQSGYQDDV